MPLVYATHVPNAPHLIAPEAFGGRGQRTADALRRLNLSERYRPEAIVVATPHWVSGDRFLVQGSAHPRQIRDFSGFPPSVSAVTYRPPGDPELAGDLVHEGERSGIPVARSEEWGLDHGAWAPLLNLFPSGDLPTVPLSIARRTGPEHLQWGTAIGRALAASSRRIVFVSTGSILHSFTRFNPSSDAPWPEGAEIEREIAELARARRVDELLSFDRRKWRFVEPEGDLNPLVMLLGALPPEFVGRVGSTEQLHGAFGMTVIEFTPAS